MQKPATRRRPMVHWIFITRAGAGTMAGSYLVLVNNDATRVGLEGGECKLKAKGEFVTEL
jgi:hypothetical protein